MKEPEITLAVLGGPYDGLTARIRFDPGTDTESVFAKMAFVEFAGHNYQIIEFDKDAMHGTVKY